MTGATGSVGAHVVRGLCERGIPTRVLVRDASASPPGAEPVVGDFADPPSLARAVRGVDRVFLACGNVPGQVAYECAAVDAARVAGVERVVKLSGPHPSPDSPLVFERWHAQIEQHLLSSGVPWVLLRPRTFCTNLLASAAAVAEGVLPAPAGDCRIAYVDPRDVAACAVAALTADGPAGGVWEPSGPEALSHARIAEELSAATGRPVQYVDLPEDVARAGMLGAGLPGEVVEFVLRFFAGARAGTVDTSATGAVRALTGHDARPFAEFARERAAAFGRSPVRAAAT
ncbi:NmrA family NAD(P)-binding protein [Kineococcus sp. SYSU DK003]|uniref:NmrA family NAD(P)-binding protein n=1 Tax=Kineococcus sp. SYSU DK003 TaxID=3383124 RepID=UPI003D7EC81C